MKTRNLLLSALVLSVCVSGASAEINISWGPGGHLDGTEFADSWMVDDGSAFGDRGNGYNYGWFNGAGDPDPQDANRNRNNAASPSELYDTLNHMRKGDVNSWKIEIPNGEYNVHLVAGDPNHTDQENDINVVGGSMSVLIDDEGDGNNFDEFDISITVDEGFLQLVPVEAANNQKVSHMSITAVPEPGSIVLAVFGLLGLFGLARRRR